MFRYGKLARQAVSAMSYLAERHGPEAGAVSSAEVGRERKIPVALAAKLLSQMATDGFLSISEGSMPIVRFGERAAETVAPAGVLLLGLLTTLLYLTNKRIWAPYKGKH